MDKSSIYTSTGDKGTTGLIGGTRVAKSCSQLEAYGTIDELNSQIGLLQTYLKDEHDSSFLLSVQNKLFVVGSLLATDSSKYDLEKVGKITDEDVHVLEKEIDCIDRMLPPHKNFIIPGGCRASALAHVCRTVCRRAERRIYAYKDEGYVVSEELLRYINRLSDYFFVFSRKINMINKTHEILWNNPCI
jgi:cob(I)alamin adenosyltransferase